MRDKINLALTNFKLEKKKKNIRRFFVKIREKKMNVN
jgi:hypothetical protein